MKIQTEYEDGKLCLSYCGELDHHAAQSALGESERIIDRYLPSHCFLDLSALSFMDSSGIALILRLHKRMRQNGGCFSVLAPASQPLRVICAAGLGRIVQIHSKEKETVG